ncbi:MAG: hypothetical protein R3F49_17620 [Planctomycetota bacterium]
MEPAPNWYYAVVRIHATDAWIPVNDAKTITDFAADPGYEVHHATSPAAMIALLQHPHDGALRATRELLGMLPLPHFRVLVSTMTGAPIPIAPQADRPERVYRRPPT